MPNPSTTASVAEDLERLGAEVARLPDGGIETGRLVASIADAVGIERAWKLIRKLKRQGGCSIVMRNGVGWVLPAEKKPRGRPNEVKLPLPENGIAMARAILKRVIAFQMIGGGDTTISLGERATRLAMEGEAIAGIEAAVARFKLTREGALKVLGLAYPATLDRILHIKPDFPAGMKLRTKQKRLPRNTTADERFLHFVKRAGQLGIGVEELRKSLPSKDRGLVRGLVELYRDCGLIHVAACRSPKSGRLTERLVHADYPPLPLDTAGNILAHANDNEARQDAAA